MPDISANSPFAPGRSARWILVRRVFPRNSEREIIDAGIGLEPGRLMIFPVDPETGALVTVDGPILTLQTDDLERIQFAGRREWTGEDWRNVYLIKIVPDNDDVLHFCFDTEHFADFYNATATELDRLGRLDRMEIGFQQPPEDGVSRMIGWVGTAFFAVMALFLIFSGDDQLPLLGVAFIFVVVVLLFKSQQPRPGPETFTTLEGALRTGPETLAGPWKRVP